jgi:hypothetical protein
MRKAEAIRRDLEPRLAALGARLAAGGVAPATVVCIPRHGYGTTRTTIESLYASTRVPFNLVVVDIAGPEPVRRYLEQAEAAHDGLVHLRLDELVSRQTARLLVLDGIKTPYTVLVDNNMLFRPGCLEALVACAEETGAAMVSPVLVTHGGRIHFSGGFVEAGKNGRWRPHAQAGGAVDTPVEEARLGRLDIDFAESHCCLARTECLLRPGVMLESMHNAQTLCYAAYLLKQRHGERVVIEPGAVAAILPIAFGYDIPWLCLSYMDRDLIRGSYEALTDLIGQGPSQDPEASFAWHGKHLKYLLLTMLEGDRLTRAGLLEPVEAPPAVTGYDRPLPPDAMRRIHEAIVPYMLRHHPELFPRMVQWFG